ncbi:organic hydroperoxide reductase OsmC/OhrA [Paraburkholderia sp. GAS41]|jgi:organic hydroperoxide reductase OsmC/OhrA
MRRAQQGASRCEAGAGPRIQVGGLFKQKDIGMAYGEHKYRVSVLWTGNRGTGTSGYRDYGRDHTIRAANKPDIPGSSDAAFLGDATRWNPEDLLVASASACHKLWYLHLCSDAGIAVLDYRDDAEGTMLDSPHQGKFTQIVLRPRVTIRAGDDASLAERLHHAAHEKCYVANSVNFPILCEPIIELAAS